MSEVNLSRRGFLRGRFVAKPLALRPPWALAEAEFLRRCTRCEDCVKTCPQHIIVMRDGFPQVDFALGACTFCADCVTVCKPGALQRVDAYQRPWSIRAQVADSCLPRKGVECRVCGEHCTASAIRFSPRIGGPPVPEIQGAACTGCGVCAAPCPVKAISLSPA